MVERILNVSNFTSIKRFVPKKALIGAMLAGSMLAGGLASCVNSEDCFEKEKVEYYQKKKTNSLPSKTFITEKYPQKNKAIVSNMQFVSKEDSLSRNIGKRVTVGLLGGLFGGIAGVFRGNKSKLNTSSQCASVGAAAGLLCPGVTLTAIVTLLSGLTGACAGSFFSGGNRRAGIAVAAIFGTIAAISCIL